MTASSVMKVNKAIVFVAFQLLAMAMVEVAAVEVPFSMTPSDQPEFQLMHGLSPSGVNLYYTPPANGIVMFGLLVPAGGWVGLGWSTDCKMYDADVVIGGVGVATGSPGMFRTTPSPGRGIIPDTELATRMGLIHAWNSSIAFLTVHRSIHGGNVAINGSRMCVIWAHSNVSTTGYHGEGRRGALIIDLAANGSVAAPQESMPVEESEALGSDVPPQSSEVSAEEETPISEESGPSSVSSPASESVPAASESAPAASESAPAASGSAPAASGIAPAARQRAAAASGSAPASSGSTKRAVNPAVSIGVALIVALLTFSAYLVA